MSQKAKAKSSKKRTVSLSDSGSDSEHELFYYHNDRVQLMKEVIKILKLKKIKTLAPPKIKKMEMEEVNTLLLEELLGISNKRLKKILDGQNADDESSSSDEDKIDIISLDSISDDEICFVDETKEDPTARKKCRRKKHKMAKVKTEKETHIKTENEKAVKTERDSSATSSKGAKSTEKSSSKAPAGLENEKLLSVLELLELQARARAIRSQLALEAENKAKEAAEAKQAQDLDDGDDDDAIIIETPVINEIVISSSDSEGDEAPTKKNDQGIVKNVDKPTGGEQSDLQIVEESENHKQNGDAGAVPAKKTQKIKLIRSILVESMSTASEIVETGNTVETPENSNKAVETAVEENVSNVSGIPLPEKEVVSENCTENPEINVNVEKLDKTSENVDVSKNSDVVEEKNETNEETTSIVPQDAQDGASGNVLDLEVQAVHVNVVPVPVRAEESVEPVSNAQVTEQEEQEDDVIRLDVVDIDGIDD